jgi:hypothetical protein
MKKRTALLMVSLAVVLVLTVALGAFADDWVLLGKKTVALGADRDEIWVGSGEGTFKAIKLYVIDKGVQFDRLEVVFRNGRTVEEWIRAFIPAGGETRVIDLPGRERFISKIILYYTTRPGTLDRAQVEAWGLRD